MTTQHTFNWYQKLLQLITVKRVSVSLEQKKTLLDLKVNVQSVLCWPSIPQLCSKIQYSHVDWLL